MSEARTVILACDFCGRTHDRSQQADDAGHLSWFSVCTFGLQVADPGSWTGGAFASTVSLTTCPPRDPDLCSWECVAGYARRQADLLAAAAAARAEAAR